MERRNDLSEHHQLVGDLFPLMPTEEAWEKYKLSEDQVSFFNTNGFLANVKILDDAQVEHLRAELEELEELIPPIPAIPRIPPSSRRARLMRNRTRK